MTDLLNVLVVGLLLGGIYSLVSIGLNLIFGVIRIVNFAQGEFVMLGMYGDLRGRNDAPYGSLCLARPDAARRCSCSASSFSASFCSLCRTSR